MSTKSKPLTFRLGLVITLIQLVVILSTGLVKVHDRAVYLKLSIREVQLAAAMYYTQAVVAEGKLAYCW